MKESHDDSRTFLHTIPSVFVLFIVVIYFTILIELWDLKTDKIFCILLYTRDYYLRNSVLYLIKFDYIRFEWQWYQRIHQFNQCSVKFEYSTTM